MNIVSPLVDVGADPLAPTIFHESWWLDIATGGRCAVVEVEDQGKVVGRLPYFLQKQKGCFIANLPPLTHFLGPVILGCDGKPSKQFSYRHDVTKELILKLPKTSSFYIKCHRDVTDVVPFQGCGFRAGVQFTQEVRPQSIDTIWKEMRRKARNSIRGASEAYNIKEGDDPDLFMRFYTQSIEDNKGVTNFMDADVHKKLIRACLDRHRGKIYEAREHDGTLVAAIFCAWDNVASYYLMTSRRPSIHPGNTLLLVWEALKEAIENNRIFDFDGIVSEGGARAANNFAPTLSARYTALRESTPMRIYRSVKAIIRPPTFYY